MSYHWREQLTWALLLVLSGLAACSAKQRTIVHDVLDGIHGACESADPAIHLVLQRLDQDAGSDAGSDAVTD